MKFCEVCHKPFRIKKDAVYIAEDNSGVFTKIVNGHKTFHAVDCPHCKCQIILKVRLNTYKEESEGN